MYVSLPVQSDPNGGLSVKTFNSVFAGVGGQGILLAAEIVGTAAVNAGLNARVSELHGMAQRGGAVLSHVRIGEKALAATIMEGTADAILGFEPMETLRSINYASKKTAVLVNTTPLAIGGSEYPAMTDMLEQMRGFTEHIVPVEANVLAQSLGTTMVMNVVLIGVLAATAMLPMSAEYLEGAIRDLVPARYLDLNLKAFRLGFTAIKT